MENRLFDLYEFSRSENPSNLDIRRFDLMIAMADAKSRFIFPLIVIAIS